MTRPLALLLAALAGPALALLFGLGYALVRRRKLS